MNKISWILLGFLALTYQAKAQDSISSFNAFQKERADLFQQEVILQRSAPSLRPFDYQQTGTSLYTYYRYSTQKQYDWQRGSGDNILGISSETYRKTPTNWTIWGNADYKEGNTKGLKYNQTLDYERIFPYFMADSIGGNTKQQLYRFGGGLAKKAGSWSYGGSAYYQAQQSSRRVDPRPNNRSGALDLDISASYLLHNRYAISAHSGYTMYKQTAQLTFASKLKIPTIFQFNGPIAYNNLLIGSGSSSTATAYYVINSFRTGFSIQPLQNGWIASTLWQFDNGSKKIALTTDDINNWTDQKGNTQLGYRHSGDSWQWQAVAHWNTERKVGSEGLFTSQTTNNGLQKITDKSSYRYFVDDYGLSIIAGKRQQWNLQFEGNLSNIQEQYIAPYLSKQSHPLDLKLTGQYFWTSGKDVIETSLGIQKRKILEKDHTFRGVNENSGLGQLLFNNWNYMQLEPLSIDINAQWNINTFEKLFPFIGLNARHATVIDAQAVTIKVGFKF